MTAVACPPETRTLCRSSFLLTSAPCCDVELPTLPVDFVVARWVDSLRANPSTASAAGVTDAQVIIRGRRHTRDWPSDNDTPKVRTTERLHAHRSVGARSSARLPAAGRRRKVSHSAYQAVLPDLGEAFGKFGVAAMRSLAANGLAPTFVDQQHWPQKWMRDGDEQFRPLLRRVWSFQIDPVWRELSALPEYSDLRATMRSHPEIERQLNAMVGSAWSRRSVRVQDLLLIAYLSPVVEQRGAFEFDHDLAMSTYLEIEQVLLSPTVLVRQILPLLGFDAAGTVSGPLDEVVVRRLTDQEISRLIEIGALPFQRWDQSVTVPRSWQWALVSDTLTQKVVGEPSSVTPPALPDLFEQEEVMLAAARLVGGGSVAPGPLLTLEELTRVAPNAGGSYGRRPTPGTVDPARPCFVWQPADMQNVWRTLAESTSPTLRLASRRFLDAGRRFRDEDALLDLAIAAETLFVGSGRSELTYRVALNGSLAVPVANRAPVEVRSFLKSVYAARSRIVHGDGRARFRRLDGNDAGIKQVVADLETFMATAIRTFASAEKTGNAIDVDRLVDQRLLSYE